MDTPDIVEPNGENLLFREEVETAHGFWNLKTLFLLSGVNIPHSDCLVIAPAEEPFAFEE